jgi:DNA-directed RNA polymerase
MLSSLPIRVDGTCNGIQHLSAMVRDEVGGHSVNLTPGDKPRDIYQDVADKVTAMLEARFQNEFPALWLKVFNGSTPRSVTKRPVMILPYGGTRHAYFDYTMDWLKENDPQGKDIPVEKRAEAVSYLVTVLWEAVSETVVSAREVMAWLQACAQIAAQTGLPLTWKTPSGFYVRHFYGERERKQIETKIDGQRLQLVKWETTATLDKAAQLKGIAPNFVHSMDASSLVTSVNIAKENGIDSITTIHDAYGTVAADMWKLTACLREGFIATYSEPVLEQYLIFCRDVNSEAAKWPKSLPEGTLDLQQIRDSDYFFA